MKILTQSLFVAVTLVFLPLRANAIEPLECSIFEKNVFCSMYRNDTEGDCAVSVFAKIINKKNKEIVTETLITQKSLDFLDSFYSFMLQTKKLAPVATSGAKLVLYADYINCGVPDPRTAEVSLSIAKITNSKLTPLKPIKWMNKMKNKFTDQGSQ